MRKLAKDIPHRQRFVAQITMFKYRKGVCKNQFQKQVHAYYYSIMEIKAEQITQKLFSPYGDLISTRSDVTPSKANLGYADRFNHLTHLRNLRGEKAEANLCLFSCQPMVKGKTFKITLLERHSQSSQVFIPMSGVKRYLVIVALGATPDLKTLKAFLVSGEQGISYHPGVWHHPLVAMDQISNFACLVWENATSEDCDEVNLQTPIDITF